MRASVVSARWLYCERRSGACGGRARSSLLRRSSGYASSVVAALARLGSRLDALATSHLADTTLALRADAERAEADGARVRDDPQPVGPELAERRVALVGAHAAGPVPRGGEQALAVDALPEERVEGDLGRAPPPGTVGRRGTEDAVLIRVGAVQRLVERLAAHQAPARRSDLLGGERLIVDRPLGPEEVAHALVHGRVEAGAEARGQAQPGGRARGIAAQGQAGPP